MNNAIPNAAARRMLDGLSGLASGDEAEISFGKIVQARKLGRVAGLGDEAAAVEVELTRKFEAREGSILNSYFCTKAMGGCALVGPVPHGGDSSEGRPLALHTVLNSVDARLITVEARCNDMADQVVQTLAGKRSYKRLMHGALLALYSVMTRVLSAADLEAGHADPARVTAAVAAAEADLASAQRRAEIVVQRWARSIYLQGVLIGAVLALVVSAALGVVNAHLWWNIVPTAPTVLAVAFGALGAVVSVFQRMSTGKLILDVTADASDIRAIAVLRPVVGGVFGAVVSFALSGGLLASAGGVASKSLGLFAVAGFAAGFSERLAVDMVERAGRMLFGDPTKSALDPQAPVAGGLVAPVAPGGAPAPAPLAATPAGGTGQAGAGAAGAVVAGVGSAATTVAGGPAGVAGAGAHTAAGAAPANGAAATVATTPGAGELGGTTPLADVAAAVTGIDPDH